MMHTNIIVYTATKIISTTIIKISVGHVCDDTIYKLNAQPMCLPNAIEISLTVV